MLAIILGILKVIGITLLVILGLVLLIIAIVLFVPIRYKGNGVINDLAKEAHLKVTWLLHAVHVQVNYCHPAKPEIIIKVLGINIEKFRKKKQEMPVTEAPAVVTEAEDSEPVKESSNDSSKEAGESANTASESVSAEEEPVVSEHMRQLVEQAQALQKETWRDKLKRIVNKITSVYNKIKNVIQNIRYYMDILQEEDTHALIKVALEALADIFKSIRPRKLVANAKIGFDTPDTTGKVYGLYWILKPALGEHVVIEPDFEKKIIEGDILFKGHITIFVLVVNALKIVFDKRFKPLINKIKNGGLQNG